MVVAVGVTVYATVTSRSTDSSAARIKDVAGAKISLVESNVKLGDTIHFTYTLPRGVKEAPNGSGTQARIQVMCYLNDALVYGEALNAIDAKTSGLLLGGAGSVWLYEHSSESTNCVTTLYQWDYTGGVQKFVPLATTTFNAAGK